MRISDWSSDVCSSDLLAALSALLEDQELWHHDAVGMAAMDARADGQLDAAHEGRRLHGDPPRIGRLLSRHAGDQIGRESCRARVCQYVSISVVAVTLKKKQTHYIFLIMNLIHLPSPSTTFLL